MPAPFEDLLDSGKEATGLAGALVFWGDDPTAWDKVTLGRVELPGVARIKGNGLQWKTDKKYVSGKNGRTNTTLGRDAASFTIVLRLWTSQHLTDYSDIVKTFRPTERASTGSKVREALEVSHPALTLYGIASCLVMNATLPEPDTDDRVNFYSVRIDCVEFVPDGKKSAEVKTNKFSLESVPQALGPRVDAALLKQQQSPATQNRQANTSYPDGAGFSR